LNTSTFVFTIHALEEWGYVCVSREWKSKISPISTRLHLHNHWSFCCNF